MANVNIFHNALSFNTKESGEGGGGLSIHVNGDTGGDSNPKLKFDSFTVNITSDDIEIRKNKSGTANFEFLNVKGFKAEPYWMTIFKGSAGSKSNTKVTNLIFSCYTKPSDSYEGDARRMVLAAIAIPGSMTEYHMVHDYEADPDSYNDLLSFNPETGTLTIQNSYSTVAGYRFSIGEYHVSYFYYE